MKKYNVIWFDDEFSSLNLIQEKALLSNILLKGFKSAKEGLEELERNPLQYDAAIVDGNFFRNPDQTFAKLDDSAFFDVALALEKLSGDRKLPWFILSGQLNFTNEKNRFADGFKNNKVYDKTKDDDLIALWSDLKLEADQRVDTRIRNDYTRVFEVCKDRYIGDAASQYLLSILRRENAIAAFADPHLYFNPMRKVVEDFFIACNKFGLLPDVFIKPTVALNESSKFLSGNTEKGYRLDSPVFPKVISDNVRCILSICQPASHRSEIDRFITLVDSPYLLLSITYQLLDVLLWFRMYVDENIKVEVNNIRYKQIESSLDSVIFSGIIEQDSNRNFFCGQFLLNYNFVNANFKIGDTIQIIEATDNNQTKTSSAYSKFATKFIKVN